MDSLTKTLDLRGLGSWTITEDMKTVNLKIETTVSKPNTIIHKLSEMSNNASETLIVTFSQVRWDILTVDWF